MAAYITACGGVIAVVADADVLSSPDYKFEESVLGAGGLVQSSSPNFQGAQSVGDTAIGNSQSTNYQINAGSETTSDPTLSLIINNATPNFGSFSATQAATATSSFSVSNYTSYGYAVQIVGDPPKTNAHTITAMASTGSSTTGTEQFGLNLVANTSPTSFGANPNQGQFGHGVAATNYDTPNQYRYVSGETIADSPKTSGITTFTISYIVNVGSLTPGGTYVSTQQLICTGTY